MGMGGVGLFAADNVAGEDDEVGLFELGDLAHELCGFEVVFGAVEPVGVGELDDFEFAVLVKTEVRMILFLGRM